MDEYHTIVERNECPVCYQEITSAKAIGWIDDYGFTGYAYKCVHCSSKLLDTTY